MDYKTAAAISKLARWFICFMTIETTPIFENSLIAWGLDQIISVYFILWLVAYTIVGRGFGYRRGDDPILGVILYAIVHTILVFVLWAILAILTAFGILPI